MSFIRCFIMTLVLIHATTSAFAADKRSRLLDFDDQLVEGMNKKPLDSLQQLTDGRGGRQRAHLYRKRAAFRMETDETLSEVRLAQ